MSEKGRVLLIKLNPNFQKKEGTIMTKINIARIMRLSLVGVILVIAVTLLTSATQEAAETQLAKRGKFTGTGSYSGAVLKAHSFGEALKFMLVEYNGATKNDAGSGLFHNMSFDCAFSVEIPEMPTTVSNGYCTFFDSDGDEIYFNASVKGVLGVGGEATTQLIGGTGKYAGITGGGWYKNSDVRPASPGTFQGFIEFGGNYQLP